MEIDSQIDTLQRTYIRVKSFYIIEKHYNSMLFLPEGWMESVRTYGSDFVYKRASKRVDLRRM